MADPIATDTRGEHDPRPCAVDGWTAATPDQVLARMATLLRAAESLTGSGLAGQRDADQRAAARRAASGSVVLTPSQCEAAARCEALIAREGGALLADAVGTGKTYVALGVARNRGPALVIAPAALRPMWRAAAQRCGISLAAVLSIEALGRRDWRPPAQPPALVIVDEAHHARNPTTVRYTSLARLCSQSPVLLLSATPVHNHARDLRALLALFLGSAAVDADPDRYLVRRSAPPDARPRVRPAVVCRLPPGDDLLALLTALPPATPPAGAGESSSLAMLGLVRQWASSDGALRAAIVRRLTAAAALQSALRDGALPDRRALQRWIVGEGTVQLGLPGLDPPTVPMPDDTHGPSLAVAIDRHILGLQTVLARLGPAENSAADRARAGHLRALLDTGAQVVAFSHSADTVRTLYRHLRTTGGVAMLTSQGARVAGGALTRQEALERFAPRAQGVAPPREAESIRLLLSTDLLSEGVNLQDANVVVHAGKKNE